MEGRRLNGNLVGREIVFFSAGQNRFLKKITQITNFGEFYDENIEILMGTFLID